MFLARTWKTVNGKRYESWVLKAGIWDKEHKRYKQVHCAYVGKSRNIQLEKALAICQKLGITLEELRRVKRLRIMEKGPIPVIQPQETATAIVTPNTSSASDQAVTAREPRTLDEVPASAISEIFVSAKDPSVAVEPHEEQITVPTLAPGNALALVVESPGKVAIPVTAETSTSEHGPDQVPQRLEELAAPVIPGTSTLASGKGLTIAPQPQVEGTAVVTPETSTPRQTPSLDPQRPEWAAGLVTVNDAIVAAGGVPHPVPEAKTAGTPAKKEEATTSETTLDIPSLIRELRERFKLGKETQDYQKIAIRIGAIHVTALELRLAEAGRTVLALAQQKRIEEAWKEQSKSKDK